MGCFRRMVPIVEPTSIWSVLGAMTRDLRRGHPVNWRRRATAARLLHLLSFLIVRWRLLVHVIALIPLTHPLWRRSWGSFVALTRSGLGGSESRSGRRGTASYATPSRISVMCLIRPLIAIARRTCSVFYDGPHLWRWGAVHAVGRARSLARWPIQPGWRRWRRPRWSSLRAVVGVRDAGRGLLLMGRQLSRRRRTLRG
jgi:hypothetical protein